LQPYHLPSDTVTIIKERRQIATEDNVSWLFNLDKDSAEKQPIEDNELESQLKALLPEGYLDTESEL